MPIDIEKLDLKELRDLKKKVDRAIDGFEEKKRAKAIEAVRAAAEQYGFKINDLIGEAAPKTKVAPKYANPHDPSMTWSGRGRAPQWVKDQIANGKKVEEFAI